MRLPGSARGQRQGKPGSAAPEPDAWPLPSWRAHAAPRACLPPGLPLEMFRDGLLCEACVRMWCVDSICENAAIHNATFMVRFGCALLTTPGRAAACPPWLHLPPRRWGAVRVHASCLPGLRSAQGCHNCPAGDRLVQRLQAQRPCGVGRGYDAAVGRRGRQPEPHAAGAAAVWWFLQAVRAGSWGRS